MSIKSAKFLLVEADIPRLHIDPSIHLSLLHFSVFNTSSLPSLCRAKLDLFSGQPLFSSSRDEAAYSSKQECQFCSRVQFLTPPVEVLSGKVFHKHSQPRKNLPLRMEVSGKRKAKRRNNLLRFRQRYPMQLRGGGVGERWAASTLLD